MNIRQKTESRYSVTITFKPSTKRQAIEASMPVREYRRMNKEFLKGQQNGTYTMFLENTETVVTFPLQDMDTIHAVPEVDLS